MQWQRNLGFSSLDFPLFLNYMYLYMYLWKAPEFYQNNDIYIIGTGLEALFPIVLHLQ